MGSTLSFAKSQAFEDQCTQEVGKEGAGHISTAIALGTIKHPELAVTENPWYTSVPTVLPTTRVENDMVNSYSELKTKFSLNKDGENMLVDLIASGYNDDVYDAEDAAATVSDDWGGMQYLNIKQDAWDRLLEYYAAIG